MLGHIWRVKQEGERRTKGERKKRGDESRTTASAELVWVCIGSGGVQEWEEGAKGMMQERGDELWRGVGTKGVREKEREEERG